MLWFGYCTVIFNIFWISRAARREGEIQQGQKFNDLCGRRETARKTVMMSNELPHRLHKEIRRQIETKKH